MCRRSSRCDDWRACAVKELWRGISLLLLVGARCSPVVEHASNFPQALGLYRNLRHFLPGNVQNKLWRANLPDPRWDLYLANAGELGLLGVNFSLTMRVLRSLHHHQRARAIPYNAGTLVLFRSRHRSNFSGPPNVGLLEDFCCCFATSGHRPQADSSSPFLPHNPPSKDAVM